MLENVVEGFTERKLHGRGPRLRGTQGRGPDVGTPQVQEPSVTSQGSAGESFDEIFLTYYSRVVGILQRMVGDHGRAEDLASEVFLKLYRQPLPHDADGNVPGWLYRTATNLGIDALRSAARRNRFEQAAAQDARHSKIAENGFDQTLRSERQQRVRGVLADLKPVQAQLLLLRASGHSYKELAAALAIEPGSVGTILVRAEAAFEQRYREVYGREEDI